VRGDGAEPVDRVGGLVWSRFYHRIGLDEVLAPTVNS
jgi:hypothetical protein